MSPRCSSCDAPAESGAHRTFMMGPPLQVATNVGLPREVDGWQGERSPVHASPKPTFDVAGGSAEAGEPVDVSEVAAPRHPSSFPSMSPRPAFQAMERVRSVDCPSRRPPVPGARARSFTDPGSRPLHDPVSQAISPGDVLFVRSNGYLAGLAQVGAVGGLAGHVMLVIAPPKVILRDSDDFLRYEIIWPAGGVREIWSVRTLESTRGEAGLHESEVLVRLEPRTGRLVMFGDANEEGTEYGWIADEEMPELEVWRSPAPLRDWLQRGIVMEVVADMKKCDASWSLATAVRAVFRSANTFSGADRAGLLAEITGCWQVDPICTSVVIIFWQRYLCKLANSAFAKQISGPEPEALDLILKWMPLKADRGLPGELLQTMQRCGWVRIQQFGNGVHTADASMDDVGLVGPTSDCVRPGLPIATDDVMAEVAADIRCSVAALSSAHALDDPALMLEHESCTLFGPWSPPRPVYETRHSGPFLMSPREFDGPLPRMPGDTCEHDFLHKVPDQIVNDALREELSTLSCGSFKSFEYQDSFANQLMCVVAT